MWWSLLFFNWLPGFSKPGPDRYLHNRTPYPCFTNGLIAVISSPYTAERWAHMKYRLRSCDELLVQESYNGKDARDLALWLPVDKLELILDSVLGWTWRWIPPYGGSRRQHARRVLAFTYPFRKSKYEKVTSSVIRKYGKGDRVRMSIWFTDELALWKLQRLDRFFLRVPSPCFLIMEDDTAIRPVYWHVTSVDDICEKGFEVTQLFYLLWNIHEPNDLARSFQEEYLRDGLMSADHLHFWGANGMLWNSETLQRALEDISFDEDDPSHPYLNCKTQCFPDHVWRKAFNFTLPTTPIVAPQLAAASTYRKISFIEQWQSVQPHWAAFYQAEIQSFGAATAAQSYNSSTSPLDGQDVQKKHSMLLALFHTKTDLVSTRLNTSLGAVTVEWLEQKSPFGD
eukprot:Protomagalhaensia_sp_Gyna_25__2632@NODE_24_length_7526_cov_33_797783_g17_i0_p4_GENE_NODE_24_length_7526_cov_33_797783_g17_i0NODE_24_length_7526_cov_33_797783_g17_i0_p4_ORF_typecomplete_len398_score44_98_NODE_24_length_7526_cov_33_797783_g17_i062617454